MSLEGITKLIWQSTGVKILPVCRVYYGTLSATQVIKTKPKKMTINNIYLIVPQCFNIVSDLTFIR